MARRVTKREFLVRGRAKTIKKEAPDLADKVRGGKLSLDAADKERKKRNAALPKPEKPKPAKVTLTLHTHDGTEVSYPKPQSAAKFNETTGPGISWATSTDLPPATRCHPATPPHW